MNKIVFDAHGDILTDMYLQYKETNKYDSFKRRHLDKYKKANIKGSIFVNYTDPFNGNKEMFNEIFDVAFKELEENKDILSICLNMNDFFKAVSEDKIGVFLGIEGLSFLEDINELRSLYNKGIRHAIITWNEVNKYGSGISENKTGLTDLGIQLVKEMNKLGMIIDLAHSNEKTFFDILNNTKGPIIISHGNCKALCNHPRNYTDKQLIAIKERKGVIGLTNIAGFISKKKKNQTVKYLAKHIDYAVKLLGIDYVGLGLDICFYLDPLRKDTRVKGFEDIDKLDNLRIELSNLGYTKEEIEKIMHKNFLRVIADILK